MLKIYKIIENTKVEGPGNRFCIWTQGCRKHCIGCFAKDTWDFNGGNFYSIKDLFTQIKATPNIEGVTYLGGEPFEQAKPLYKLSKLIKKETNLSIVCFTGYTLEELHNKKDQSTTLLLENIDLLIDGGFEQENFDISRPWIGSSNQKYHFLTNFYNQTQINNYKNKIEARISQDGKLEINGMGNFEKLNKKFYLQLGKNIVK